MESSEKMLDPAIPTSKGEENRYMLAAIIGKRAAQLANGSEMLIDCSSSNNVTIAISEYKAHKLCYVEDTKKL